MKRNVVLTSLSNLYIGDVPILLVYTNVLVNSIPCNEMKLVGYAQRDDASNEYLSYEDGIAWMRRLMKIVIGLKENESIRLMASL